jgi:hypothetical protein
VSNKFAHGEQKKKGPDEIESSTAREMLVTAIECSTAVIVLHGIHVKSYDPECCLLSYTTIFLMTIWQKPSDMNDMLVLLHLRDSFFSLCFTHTQRVFSVSSSMEVEGSRGGGASEQRVVAGRRLRGFGPQ